MRTTHWKHITAGLAVWLGIAAQTLPLMAQTVTITVTPTTSSQPVGGGRTLTAQVTGATNPAVAWSIKGGQQYGIGSISVVGANSCVYWAPLAIPAGGTVTVTATSVESPAVSASCVVSIRNQIPWLTAVTPNPITAGPVTLTVTGSRFVTGAVVSLNGKALTTTFVSATQLTAQGNATAADAINGSITVANPGPSAVSTPFKLTSAVNVTVSLTPTSTTLQAGGSAQFQGSAAGAADTSVTYSIVGATDGSLGTISAAGLYTAPSILPLAGAVTVQATAVADPAKSAKAVISFQDPEAVKIGRFLEQTSTAPTPQTIAAVKQAGLEAYLDQQLSMPESTWGDAATATRQSVTATYFYNLTNGQDQLRQRTLYALTQIYVCSMVKNTNGDQWVPWLQLLSRNAFGNFRTLIKEVTLSPTMAIMLDLANSSKQTATNAPNENYARELMQLFTIGLVMLNEDGTVKLDAQGQTIPTYDQTTVREMARALTGWTYPTPPGGPYKLMNPSYYPGVLEPRPTLHDTGAKTLVNDVAVPAGQSTEQDLESVVDAVFLHPNTPPFICQRLIRSLVMSHPSPAYVSDIVQVFKNDGSGTRGNLKAVIRAIIMHPAARNDSSQEVTQGRLRTPVQHWFGFMRTLGFPLATNNVYGYEFIGMGEAALAPPSVFGNYAQLYRLPGTGITAPEFQICSAAEIVNRANSLYQFLNNYNNDISAWVNLAADPATLVGAVDRTLLFGRMSPELRGTVLEAVQKTADLRTRAITALYLTLMDGEFLIQR
ncbi:MAG: DUF1800 family protein [Prosthecobacter sp.]|uniref:DUF1800 family protein n=1 Tax=Prosthecobacter sp. TaxID=1965333 RepID=UPI0038FE2C86